MLKRQSDSLEQRAISAGEEPRALNAFLLTESKTGHVESCLNMGGPPSKPKY